VGRNYSVILLADPNFEFWAGPVSNWNGSRSWTSAVPRHIPWL